MGTETMDFVLAHDISSINPYPIFLVFLDLRKAYNTVDCGRLIKTLEGYSLVPQMYKLLAILWSHQGVVTINNEYHGPNCKATQGTNQGGIMSLALFNAVVDNLGWAWITMAV